MEHLVKVGISKMQNSRSVPYEMRKKEILNYFCCFCANELTFSSFVLIMKTIFKIQNFEI